MLNLQCLMNFICWLIKQILILTKLEKLQKMVTQEQEAMPTAGFAAGPCLLKDTMQLLSFSRNNFSIGNSSMLVNEGMVCI